MCFISNQIDSNPDFPVFLAAASKTTPIRVEVFGSVPKNHCFSFIFIEMASESQLHTSYQQLFESV